MKELLKKAGLTQVEFAKRLGVTQSLISQWISGICQPNIKLLPNIAEILNVSVDEIVALFCAETA
ncbi:MAG TPA: helix-turn-helix transcriptional regulator [Candidatus Coproplasma excrementipullorum]|nr:helix-turn-helix transcriptional regulator [Candidatus Coproplasma excrementipullorum]